MDGGEERLGAAVYLRPVGNPAPLAFFALAAATLTLSGMQLGWIPAGEAKDVALVLIGFAFPLQLVAAIFAFLARDGAAAEAFGLLSGAWLVTGLVTISSPPGGDQQRPRRLSAGDHSAAARPGDRRAREQDRRRRGPRRSFPPLCRHRRL